MAHWDIGPSSGCRREKLPIRLVILSGMGKDGAKWLLNMKNNGALNIGQSEKSCVVYGMPKAAFELGAVSREYDLSRIPEVLVSMCQST